MSEKIGITGNDFCEEKRVRVGCKWTEIVSLFEQLGLFAHLLSLLCAQYVPNVVKTIQTLLHAPLCYRTGAIYVVKYILDVDKDQRYQYRRYTVVMTVLVFF